MGGDEGEGRKEEYFKYINILSFKIQNMYICT